MLRGPLGDPHLRLAFWRPGSRDGPTATATRRGPVRGRVLTAVERDGRPAVRSSTTRSWPRTRSLCTPRAPWRCWPRRTRGRAGLDRLAAPAARLTRPDRGGRRDERRALERDLHDVEAGGRHRRRPDPPPRQARRPVHGGALPRGDGSRPGRREDVVGRHRRDRRRQGARPVRGRDDARALPGRGARRGRQAASAGPHRRFGRWLHRHRRGISGPGGRAPPGADRGIREAVGVQRDVGAVGAGAVQHAGPRRRGRLLRAPRALLHPPLRRARPTSARSSRPRTGRTR